MTASFLQMKHPQTILITGASSGFGKVIEDAAAQNGGTLVLSQEAMQIDGGFILVYGGEEENCSLQTIFHTQREYLADKVHEFLIQEN